MIIVKIVFGFILSLVLVGYLYFQWAESRYFVKTIPTQLEIESTRHSNSESDFIREACGVHIYVLTEETIQEINKLGLDFFKNVNQGRGFKRDYYYTYGEWQKTPRHDWKRSENYYELYDCGKLSGKLLETVVNGGTKLGSFYTMGNEKSLMVIPSKQLLVLVHNG